MSKDEIQNKLNNVDERLKRLELFNKSFIRKYGKDNYAVAISIKELSETRKNLLSMLLK